jgi:hypothetical protein
MRVWVGAPDASAPGYYVDTAGDPNMASMPKQEDAIPQSIRVEQVWRRVRTAGSGKFAGLDFAFFDDHPLFKTNPNADFPTSTIDIQAYLQGLEGAECRDKKPALEIRVKAHGLAGSEKGRTARAKRSPGARPKPEKRHNRKQGNAYMASPCFVVQLLMEDRLVVARDARLNRQDRRVCPDRGRCGAPCRATREGRDLHHFDLLHR